MNKKQLKKELKRIQKVEQELNVRIDELEKNTERVERVNAEQERVNAEQERVNAEQERVNAEQAEIIKEQKEIIKEQKEEINGLKEDSKSIRRVQEQQGIDIAALAKTINSLEDKKISFEEEYANLEEYCNTLIKFMQDHPDLPKGTVSIGPIKQAMKESEKSMRIIQKRLNSLHGIVNELEHFDEFNYNHKL